MRYLLATLALVAAPLAAVAQGPITESGTITHRPASAHFPERVGPFRRVSAHQYDQAGTDVSASYRVDEGPNAVVLSVYVYPGPRVAAAPGSGSTAAVARATLCQEQFRGAVQAISTNAPGVEIRPVASQPAPAVDGVGPGLSQRAAFQYEANFNGSRQPVDSQALLYCDVASRWLVKYRVTSSRGFDVEALVADFIRTGPWPGRPAPADPGKIAARAAGPTSL